MHLVAVPNVGTHNSYAISLGIDALIASQCPMLARITPIFVDPIVQWLVAASQCPMSAHITPTISVFRKRSDYWVAVPNVGAHNSYCTDKFFDPVSKKSQCPMSAHITPTNRRFVRRGASSGSQCPMSAHITPTGPG